MTIVLTPTGEHEVSTRDGLWMSGADAARAAGWTQEQLIETILCESLRRHGLLDH